MDPFGSDPGPRNAPSARGGILLVSLYSWTCITIGVAVARFVVAYIHKVEFAFDDFMVLAATVSGRSAMNDQADDVLNSSSISVQRLLVSMQLILDKENVSWMSSPLMPCDSSRCDLPPWSLTDGLTAILIGRLCCTTPSHCRHGTRKALLGLLARARRCTVATRKRHTVRISWGLGSIFDTRLRISMRFTEALGVQST